MKHVCYCVMLAMSFVALVGCVENQNEGLAELDRLALQAARESGDTKTTDRLEGGEGSFEIEEFEPSQAHEPYTPGESRPPENPEIESFEPSQPLETTPVSTPTREAEISPSQPTQPPQYYSPQAQTQPPIRLRAGVALPQTGPEGILMGFSVDYQFTRESPQSSSQYRWVIKGKAGVIGAIPIRLKQEGNLATLVNKLRPEQGPFESWIEEKPRSGDVRVISDREQMR